MRFRSICVFGGHGAGARPEYAAAARDLGRHLASRAIRLVTGGGRVGMMGEVADAVLAGGGEVVGVITERLDRLELGHPGLTRLVVVPTMHDRKAAMADLADAFVALPGGWGTLEETFEAITWAQLNIQHKPVGLLDVAGYFRLLLAFADHACAQGFVDVRHRRLLAAAPTPPELLAALERVEFPELAEVLAEAR